MYGGQSSEGFLVDHHIIIWIDYIERARDVYLHMSSIFHGHF